MDRTVESNVSQAECPGSSEEIEQRIHEAVQAIIRFVQGDCDGLCLSAFENSLWPKVALLYRLLLGLFLAVRHERLDVKPHLTDGQYRVKDHFAVRTLKTFCGAVAYGRAYLLDKKNGGGWFPLDAALGITADGFSLRVSGLVTRLATRVSYAAARAIFKTFMGWSPSSEAVEQLVLGFGSRTWAYMVAAPPPEDDGEVLVIEVDGKATPTATEEELAKRRGPRKKHARGCSCGCQRHRGQQKRQGKKKKRRKRGDKSKNGRSITLVVMYTLRRGEDGRLHGPINKQVWGTYAKRKVALEWARQQATRRGFPPETSKCVQIVLDGEKCLYQRLSKLFPNAIFTLDVRHAQERLWKAGRQLHKEGSEELKEWVESLNQLLLAGKVKAVLKRLRKARDSISKRGPNTKGKRKTLQEQIDYFEPRAPMMRYNEYREQDLVLATGNVEGAARYVVGERLDCSGMRWIPERAEALLHLRCIELNGDWEDFMHWFEEQYTEQLKKGEPVQIRTNKPPALRKAA